LKQLNVASNPVKEKSPKYERRRKARNIALFMAGYPYLSLREAVHRAIWNLGKWRKICSD
jgi:hypothetical protein